MLMLEIIAYYSMRNKDLFDVLEDIYEKYGYYLEIGESIVLKGIEGKEKIKVFITTSNGRCLKGVGKENLSIYKVQTDVLGNKRFIKKEGDAPKLEF